MSDLPFYKDHWVNIDRERLDRYATMFEWNPASMAFYEPAAIEAGHHVAELGCGPGHTAVEIARWVGAGGHVHALDINTGFVEQARANARAAGLGDRITAHVSDGASIPLPGDCVDRGTVRNTLIYVDDPLATLGEFRRIIRPGGRVHAVEGDWPMMVLEPIPTSTWEGVVAAAGHACATPDIGRKLTGLLARSGFEEVDVQVIVRPDTSGRLLPMIRNMVGYAVAGSGLSGEEAGELTAGLERAVDERTYLALAPQFVVTGEVR